MPTTVTKATVWSFLFSPVVILSHILVSGVLARVLNPGDYGSFAAANSVVMLIGQVSQRGVAMAITRRKQLLPEDIGDTYIISVGIAVFFVLALHITAPLVIYDRIQIEITRFMTVPLAVTLMTSPAIGLLQRDMRVVDTNILMLSSLLIGSGAVTISFALAGFGGWSLAFGASANALLVGIGSIWFTRASGLRIRFAPGQWGAMLADAVRLSGLRAVDTCWVQAPVLIAARIVSVESVGVLQRMHYLSLLIYQTTIWSGITVLYPMIAGGNTTEAQLRQQFSEFLRFYFYLAAILLVFSWINAEDIVLVLFGAQWTIGATVLRVLLCGSACFTLSQVAVSFQEARGKFGHRYVVAVGSLGTMLAFAAASWRLGPQSPAWAFTLSAALMTGGSISFVARWLGLRPREMWYAFLPGLVTAALLCATLLVMDLALNPLLAPGIKTLFPRSLAVLVLLVFSARFAIPRLLREGLARNIGKRLGDSRGVRRLVGRGMLQITGMGD